jgi:DNA mismatch repair protein MSH5
MHDLDEQVGDLDALIKDTESLVASQLEYDILECEGELRETFSALADLDCTLALSNLASQFQYVRPVVVPASEKCIIIRKGGHPLQEQIIARDFVRNDTVLNDVDNNRVNILTGPNFSGKSCYARQVGILTYMAHIGSFLPCESARISLVDRILSHFGAVETCSVPQSSFQYDLTRMGSIFRTATEHSLVLIDEFGKGALLLAAVCSIARIYSPLPRNKSGFWHCSIEIRTQKAFLHWMQMCRYNSLS